MILNHRKTSKIVTVLNPTTALAFIVDYVFFIGRAVNEGTPDSWLSMVHHKVLQIAQIHVLTKSFILIEIKDADGDRVTIFNRISHSSM